jgi:hypothetical protein
MEREKGTYVATFAQVDMRWLCWEKAHIHRFSPQRWEPLNWEHEAIGHRWPTNDSGHPKRNMKIIIMLATSRKSYCIARA